MWIVGLWLLCGLIPAFLVMCTDVRGRGEADEYGAYIALVAFGPVSIVMITLYGIVKAMTKAAERLVHR